MSTQMKMEEGMYSLNKTYQDHNLKIGVKNISENGGKTLMQMLLLACPCLNVKISTRATESDYNQAKQENLTEDYIPTGFFKDGEVEVELDTEGIKQEHSYLVHRRKIGNFTLFRCLCCGVTCYALRDSSSQVLVNNQLLYDTNVIDRLKRSPDYSSVFNIVLLNKDSQFTGTMPDPNSRSYESLQYNLNNIQQQLADFVSSEEEALETRIRAFEEQERADFNELQLKTREDKKRMISLLLTTAHEEERSPTERTSPRQQEPMKSSSDTRKTPIRKKAAVSRAKSMPPTMEQSSENDDLFSFDGFQDNADDTLYADSSSEEDEDTDVEESEPLVRPTGAKRPLMYSTSVPISVPTWGSDKVQQYSEDENTPADPDQIQASMQALAQSITDDHRYIFGDRPRPRLNTGDFNR